jgi:hypothetical protein
VDFLEFLLLLLAIPFLLCGIVIGLVCVGVYYHKLRRHYYLRKIRRSP